MSLSTREFTLYNGVFDYHLTVIVGGKYKDAEKRLKQVKPRFSKYPEAYAAVFAGKYLDHIMWFYREPSPALVAHEALHSVQHVLSTHEVELSDHTEEVFACLLEWTVREVWKKLYTDGKKSSPSEEPEKLLLTTTLEKKRGS